MAKKITTLGEMLTGKPGPALRLNVLLPEDEYRYLYALLTEHDSVSQVGRDLLARLLPEMGKKINSLNTKHAKSNEKK